MNITTRFDIGSAEHALGMHSVLGTACNTEDGGLPSLCKTEDQRRALECCTKLFDSGEGFVASVTAARGRGKSAALGLAVAHAVHSGAASVLISALFLENVQTLFDLIIIGLQTLGYRKPADFRVIYCFAGKKRAISRIEFCKTKQLISHLHPFDDSKMQPALLVIDEAASIPLNFIKKLLAANFVLLASTTGGYEGTGRAFKTKLIEHLKSQGTAPYHAIELTEPIRYGKGDPVEEWLNRTLLLDAMPTSLTECPPPSECRFFYVNKTVLFSGTRETEQALAAIFSVFTASHYRNSPDDLQILADAQNHEVFVLLSTSNHILCAIQVALEGKLDKCTPLKEGNLLPWVLYENFHDEEFLKAYGTRIVRIAVHPNAYSMGYGTEALQRLMHIFKNQARDSASEKDISHYPLIRTGSNAVLFNAGDSINVPKTSWIGSSFGLTERLFNFWKMAGFLPVCIKQKPSRSTGESSVLVLRSMRCNDIFKCACISCTSILSMNGLFITRFIPLLADAFRKFTPALSLSLVHSSRRTCTLRRILFTKDEMSRLSMFSRGVVSFRHVADAMQGVAKHFFFGKTLESLPVLHQSMLLMTGCQHRDVEHLLKEFRLEEFQLSSILSKVVETVYNDFEVE